MRRSTRLASVVLTEPQLFQSDATAGVGGVGVSDNGAGGEVGGGAAGIVIVPHVDNSFEPSPNSIIEGLSDTVNDMLGLDVSQCYSPEAELLQHLSKQHLVLAELSYLMDSAGAPKYLLDRIISRLRFASILLLLLTHGLVSFKLLYGLCRYALSAFVPPSVIPTLQKNSWCGQAIKQICE
jgi:hypothetical protein